MKHKHHVWSYVILVSILAAVFAASFFIPSIKELASPENIRNTLLGAGTLGIFILIGLIALSVPFPIPSGPLVLAGGYVYGLIPGTIYALIGNVLGATFSFFLIHKFGRPLLEKFVDKKHIIHFDHLFKKRGPSIAIISYVLPLFPSDSISMILGLTPIGFPTFLAVLIMGHIPRYLIINSLGQDLHAGFTLQTFIILAIAIVFLLITIFREPIKKFLFKELKEVEHEVVKVEKEMKLI
ncbi:MAG: hypothetical protein CMH61_00775 [Nanoarchaeota archaeon]|nr:hypothetical protein [Nanoarchaeota archaeon]